MSMRLADVFVEFCANCMYGRFGFDIRTFFTRAKPIEFVTLCHSHGLAVKVSSDSTSRSTKDKSLAVRCWLQIFDGPLL